MKLTIVLSSETYHLDPKNPLDISIPLKFNGSQPVGWGAPKATAKTYAQPGFVADTQRGGSCNVEEYCFIPHCQGTHTECVGHIVNDRIAIHNVLKDTLIPSTLITVEPEPALLTEERYLPDKSSEDRLITCRNLLAKLKENNANFLEALILRTLPNNESKKWRNYLQEPPPFFSLDAIEYIVSLGVKHLLVDIPSVDRTFDEGYLSVHRTFWNIPLGEHEIDSQQFSLNTITEMIYVSDEIEDGSYLLNLQIPAFVTDAAPSRPLLYKIKPSTSQ